MAIERFLKRVIRRLDNLRYIFRRSRRRKMQRQLQPREQLSWNGPGAWIAICAVIVCCMLANGFGAQEGNRKPEAGVKASAPSTNSAPPDVAAPPSNAQKRSSGIAMKVLRPGRGKTHPEGNDCTKVSF